MEREIPKLATYLGHVHVNETYWYLEAVPELLELATRRLESAVPIWLKVVTISDADVSRKNLLESGYLPGLPAQFCSSVEVGSPSVFTWMV